MVSIHFWDARNKRRYGTPDKESDKSYEMIPWTGTQAQLKKLFSLLATNAVGILLEWDEIRHSIIAKHFKLMKTGKPYSPVVMKRLALSNYSQKKLMLIENLLKKSVG